MATYYYRLIFPTEADQAIEKTHTAEIASDRPYEVGDEIRHDGKLWRVSEAPVEQPENESTQDLMVWPAE
jgi:hypothetical protein